MLGAGGRIGISTQQQESHGRGCRFYIPLPFQLRHRLRWYPLPLRCGIKPLENAWHDQWNQHGNLLGFLHLDHRDHPGRFPGP